MIECLTAGSADFNERLQRKTRGQNFVSEDITAQVKQIIDNVRIKGDSALIDYTREFDQLNVDDIGALCVDSQTLKNAFDALPDEQKQALRTAAERIEAYHRHQLQQDWSYQEADGTILGQQITPLDSVGLYVPGGRAAYPSRVLMNAIPANVAGVKHLTMTVPAPRGETNPLVFAAAYLAGVDEVFTIGGAQAIAALAYGTERLAKVDKIVGPGNVYVAAAKRLVFGEVGIDMIAGPSEILIICDGQTHADWVVMDLFSQAEHDPDAQAILISPDVQFINQVKARIAQLLPSMPRAEIIRQSLTNRGLLIATTSIAQAIEISNQIAPEHLELSLDNAAHYLSDIKHAGAVFVGRYSCESLGDYCAGPNHVLPTSATARFSSPLGVYDFQKRSSIIQVSEQGAQTLGRVSAVLADCEGLNAHAQAARCRFK